MGGLTGQLDITRPAGRLRFAQRSSMSASWPSACATSCCLPSRRHAGRVRAVHAGPRRMTVRRTLAGGAGRGAETERLLAVLIPAAGGQQRRRQRLLGPADAISYCAGQILATGFAPELRLRMSEKDRAEASPSTRCCARSTVPPARGCCTRCAPTTGQEAVQRLREPWTPKPRRCRQRVCAFRGRASRWAWCFACASCASASCGCAGLLDCLLAPDRWWPPPGSWRGW